jgi:hypothetical protein
MILILSTMASLIISTLGIDCFGRKKEAKAKPDTNIKKKTRPAEGGAPAVLY